MTGLKRELSLTLRTKDNAEVAGLSPPLDLLKDAISSLPRNLFLSLNKIWLIVPLLKETKDVMED
jgi:hypothetical protein